MRINTFALKFYYNDKIIKPTRKKQKNVGKMTIFSWYLFILKDLVKNAL